MLTLLVTLAAPNIKSRSFVRLQVAGLGRYNADLKKRGYLLPWYTLAANLLACAGTTAITAIDFSRALGAEFVDGKNVGLSPDVDLVFGGLTLGAFGCLSTVSTLVNELRLLSPMQAVQYGGLTMGLGQLVTVPILVGFRALDGQL